MLAERLVRDALAENRSDGAVDDDETGGAVRQVQHRQAERDVD
jgi:hypothetical protein